MLVLSSSSERVTTGKAFSSEKVLLPRVLCTSHRPCNQRPLVRQPSQRHYIWLPLKLTANVEALLLFLTGGAAIHSCRCKLRDESAPVAKHEAVALQMFPCLPSCWSVFPRLAAEHKFIFWLSSSPLYERCIIYMHDSGPVKLHMGGG